MKEKKNSRQKKREEKRKKKGKETKNMKSNKLPTFDIKLESYRKKGLFKGEKNSKTLKHAGKHFVEDVSCNSYKRQAMYVLQ